MARRPRKAKMRLKPRASFCIYTVRQSDVMSGSVIFPKDQTIDFRGCHVLGVTGRLWASPERRKEVRAGENLEVTPEVDFIAIPADASNGNSRVQLPASADAISGQTLMLKNESNNRQARITLLAPPGERIMGFSRWVLRGEYFIVTLYNTGSSWMCLGKMPGRGFDGLNAAAASGGN